MKKVKTLPLVMTIVSILYFIYVVSSGDSRMIGDEIGGDPGGMLLPLVLSIFMIIGFLVITIRDRPDVQEEKNPLVTKLFVITLISAILYVVLHSIVGFIIMSALLVYVLTDLYLSIGKEKLPIWKHTAGAVLTVVVTAVVYTIFRYVTRTLLRLGRAGAIPAILGNSNVTAFISCIIVTLFVLALGFFVVKKLKGSVYRDMAISGTVSFAVTLYLYIVFRQFFMVTLAPGLLNF